MSQPVDGIPPAAEPPPPGGAAPAHGTPPGGAAPPPGTTTSTGTGTSLSDSLRRLATAYGGMFMIFGAAAMGWGLFEILGVRHDQSQPYSVIDLGLFGGGSLVAVVLLWLGVRFVVGGVSVPAVVIPEADRSLLEPLIREGNEKAIEQYVRLSSLGGATGTATQLGLTGLPLATIGLTVFFTVIAIVKPDGFLDLAKLTLGAFIGSFVQRNVSGESLTATAPAKDPPPGSAAPPPSSGPPTPAPEASGAKPPAAA